MWMRSSRVVRTSDCQCQSLNGPGFDPNILRHSGIKGTAVESLLNNLHKKSPKSLLVAVGGQICLRQLYVGIFLVFPLNMH
jgi:hypothetical protein